MRWSWVVAVLCLVAAVPVARAIWMPAFGSVAEDDPELRSTAMMRIAAAASFLSMIVSLVLANVADYRLRRRGVRMPDRFGWSWGWDSIRDACDRLPEGSQRREILRLFRLSRIAMVLAFASLLLMGL